MGANLVIEQTDSPEWSVIGGGINAFNEEQAGPDGGKSFCFALKTPGGEVVGGVIASTHWNWLYVSLMWMQPGYRRSGYGAQLLSLAEEEGRTRGAKFAYLDTFSFQAPGFYEKFGYEIFGELADFPPGHTRWFMKKEL